MLHYLDDNGEMQDAELHDEILAGGDEGAALAVSRELLQELGLLNVVKEWDVLRERGIDAVH